MQKTSQFKTQCKGDISHAFETAKITVFYPTLCKTPDVSTTNDAICAGEQGSQKVKKRKKGKKIDTGGDNFTYMGTRSL